MPVSRFDQTWYSLKSRLSNLSVVWDLITIALRISAFASVYERAPKRRYSTELHSLLSSNLLSILPTFAQESVSFDCK